MQDAISNLTTSDEYRALIRQRSRIVWPLLSLTVMTYLGFILVIAFSPASLATPVVTGGTVSVGILTGLVLILFNILLTLVYVSLANRKIEPLIAQVLAKAHAQEGRS